MDSTKEVKEVHEQKEPAAKPFRPANRGKRRKVCQFCAEKIDYVDYKDVNRLRKYISERAKILPRRKPAFSRWDAKPESGGSICENLLYPMCTCPNPPPQFP